MRDAELRELVRRAEAEPSEAIAAARALARVQRHDEAARLIWLARTRGEKGEELDAIEKSLEPASLEDFRPRVLGQGLTRPSCPTWSADGGTLFIVDGERTIVALDVRSSSERELASLDGDIVALAAEPSERWLAVAWRFATPGRPTTLVALRETSSGRSSEPVLLVVDRASPHLILTGAPGVLSATTSSRGLSFAVDPRGLLTPLSRTRSAPTADEIDARHGIVFPLRRYRLTDSAEIGLEDSALGRRRWFEFHSLPNRGHAWSPSRRCLALALEDHVLLLDGSATRPDPEPELVRARTWIELRHQSRFWRIRRIGSMVELRYGSLGQRGVFRAIRHPDEPTAARDLERRTALKESEGYRRIRI